MISIVLVWALKSLLAKDFLDGRKEGVVVQDTALDAIITTRACPKWKAKAQGVFEAARGMSITTP